MASGSTGGAEGQIKAADVERWKWEAFWDAPLYIEGSGVRPPTHATSIPPMHGIFNQPGLPRKPEEVKRATATYQANGCEVKTNGARLEIVFPGVELGVFAGRLQYTVYKGTEPDSPGGRREDRASRRSRTSTTPASRGCRFRPASRVAGATSRGNWQENQLGGAINEGPVDGVEQQPR